MMLALFVNGLFAAAAGRLLAVDSLMREPRNWFLRSVCRLSTDAGEWDLTASIDRHPSVWPLDPNSPNRCPSKWQAKLAEGATCAGCLSFWAALLAHTANTPEGAPWIIVLFATWGFAAALTRLT